jgi:hypothetical protein
MVKGGDNIQNPLLFIGRNAYMFLASLKVLIKTEHAALHEDS